MKRTEQRNEPGPETAGRKYRNLPLVGRVLRAKDTVKRMYMVWKMQREARKALEGLTEMDNVPDEVKDTDE